MSTKVYFTPDGGCIVEPDDAESYRVNSADLEAIIVARAQESTRIVKVKISAKCNDMADMIVTGAQEQVLAERDGGLPYAGVFGGDYINLVIDNATGVIEKWKPLTLAEVTGDDE